MSSAFAFHSKFLTFLDWLVKIGQFLQFANQLYFVLTFEYLPCLNISKLNEINISYIGAKSILLKGDRCTLGCCSFAGILKASK